MAFESAELAIEPLAAYSRGDVSWGFAQQQIASACDTRFARRLHWAKFLQWMMFSPVFQNYLGPFALRSQFAWNVLFRLTRGDKFGRTSSRESHFGNGLSRVPSQGSFK
jgi:hypothetical protein